MLGATLAAFVVVPVFAAIFNQPFWVNAATRIVIYALVAMSLDLIVGYGALVSFGHAAYFALGGYITAILIGNGITSAAITWPAATLAAALLALGVGALSLRTSGVYFIMITLAFGQMVYYALVGLKMFGGSDGLPMTVRSDLPLLNLQDAYVFYAVCATVLVAFYSIAARLVESRAGLVVRGAAESEKRMTSLGFPVARYRLAAFVTAAAAAGLAGALWADFSKFVSPDMASWTRSGDFLVMIILGGIGSLAGGLFGAAVLTGFESLFSSFTEHWMLVLGVALIAIVLFAKRGIYGLLAGSAMADAVLVVRGLRKAFGALIVTDDLDLDIVRGETLAVIGPNGAGKSTLVAQLAGDVRPDAGTIVFGGRSIVHDAPDLRARNGIARSFQITTLVPSFSAEDNVALAVQSRTALELKFWKRARAEAQLREPARAALERVGLLARANVRAADLSHGDARLLEVAMALACRPALLLLDEPMAGMGHDESRAMIALLRTIKAETPMLLIEHDMDAVAQLADRVIVLVAGRAIANGAYADVRKRQDVRDAYLGEN